jgi:predicted hotdog family 3-hydroxylacyl-ACP dehydratase
MLLLDEIDDYGDDWLRASVLIREGALFLEAEGVPSWVGIEWMAQAACAFAGIDRLRSGLSPRIGLLLGTRRYEANVPYFTLGQRLKVTTHLILRDADDLGVFDCHIREGARDLARAQVKACQPEDISRFID